MFKPLRHLVWALLPFGIIHLIIVCLRNKLYDWQILKAKQLPKPVISIGNLQIGGAGKTPLTISILQKLQKEGLKVAVLSRGYKRKSNEEIIILKPNTKQEENIYETIGDEATLILSELHDGILGIGANRFRVGERLFQQHPVELFLLDDGLQHRKLHRDIDICLIDVSRWQDHAFLFPFGSLRDCKSSLKRCHAVILSKVGDYQEKARKIEQMIKGKYNVPVFEADLEPQALIKLRDGSQVSLSEMKGKKAGAFCGIANPDHFFMMLKKLEVDLVLKKNFSDHHDYSMDDVLNIGKMMAERGITTAITTEKDAVKIQNLIKESTLAEFDFCYLKVDLAIKEENESFKLIQNLLSSKSFQRY